MSWKDKFPKENIYYQTDLGILYQGDCVEIMKKFPSNEINLIVSDPPYNLSNKVYREFGVDRSKFRSKIMRRGKTLNFYFGDWDEFERKDFLDFTVNWLTQCCNILKQYGTIISFFNKEDISLLVWESEKLGVRTRTIFTWCKSNPVPSFRKVNYLSSTEFIWIGSKGKWEVFNFKLQKDMLNYRITSNSSGYGETPHPTEKPLSLIQYFLEIHSNSNSLVLDPFLGSGTIAIACEKLGRRWIGIELSSNYCEIAKKRIRAEANQLKLGR